MIKYTINIFFAFLITVTFNSCKTIDKPNISNVRFDTPPSTPMKVGYTYNFKIIEEGKGDVFALVSYGSSYISQENYLPIVNGQVNYVHKSGVKYLICKKYNPSIGDFGKSDTLVYFNAQATFTQLSKISTNLTYKADDFFMVEDNRLLKTNFINTTTEFVTSITNILNYNIPNVNVLSNDLKSIISLYELKDYSNYYYYNYSNYNSSDYKISIYDISSKKTNIISLFDHSFVSPDHKYIYSYNVYDSNTDKLVLYDIANKKEIHTQVKPEKNMVLGNCSNTSNPDYVYQSPNFIYLQINGKVSQVRLSYTEFHYNTLENLKMTSDSKYVYFIFKGTIYSLSTESPQFIGFQPIYSGNASNMSLNVSNTKLLFFDKVWKTYDLKTKFITSLSVTSTSSTITW